LSSHFHVGGSDVFLQSVQLRGARNRNDPGLLRQQSRERDLRRRNIFASRNIAEQIDERQIRLAGLGRKTWNEIPEVGTPEAGILVDFPGEETRAERAEGDEANPKLLARRKNLRLGLAHPQRVLALNGGHGLHRVCAADCFRRCLGQAEVSHLSLMNELFYSTGNFLDWNLGINPVLVK